MTEQLILVDKDDIEIGTMDKLAVHQKGRLHRAFSILIFNDAGELLLQQRADSKYHSGGLWTNTCCSHPRHTEELSDAINRRLQEEMGMQCDMSFAFSFVYKCDFDNGLTENEFDHVYMGTTAQLPAPDPSEVKDWKYMSLAELQKDMEKSPDKYTVWLKVCLPKVVEHLSQQ